MVFKQKNYKDRGNKNLWRAENLTNRPPIPSPKSATNRIPFNYDNLQTDCCDKLSRCQEDYLKLIEASDQLTPFEKELRIDIMNRILRNSGRTRRRKRKKRTKQKKRRKRRKTNRKN